MSQYLIMVGLDVDLHYYGETLSLSRSCIHLHVASIVLADSYTPPFETSDLDRHCHSLRTIPFLSLGNAPGLQRNETRRTQQRGISTQVQQTLTFRFSLCLDLS